MLYNVNCSHSKKNISEDITKNIIESASWNVARWIHSCFILHLKFCLSVWSLNGAGNWNMIESQVNENIENVSA